MRVPSRQAPQENLLVALLVGGFNPSEKYESNWIISPVRGENKKCLNPTPSILLTLLYPKFKPNVGTVNNSYMEHGPLYASYKWSFNFNPCQWPEINGFHWGYVFFPKINGLSVFRAPTSNWLFGTQFVGNLMDFLGEAPHFERHLGAHLYVDGLRLKLSNFRSASRPAFFQVFSGLKNSDPTGGFRYWNKYSRCT